MIGSERSHDFKLGGKEQDPLFLLILIYIICLWLDFPPLEQHTLCREEEVSSSGAGTANQWQRM